ncbi:hypothetical protein BIW11_07905 [Tropilaelaps mercedesae]|uniref:Uncharacterized protein n=1 Tax=Tropilaelaps mercedesae TaxID=418985 RepID=A0A1V9XS34_9ACAR|nr:hypothetical protein BIW11_07905 [Tropilaelaps mercedesae]
MVVLLTALLRQSPQMYEAEDLKARLATAAGGGGGGGETTRRKRTPRPSPYETPSGQESSQGSSAVVAGRCAVGQRVTTHADDTVSSSSDACPNVRDSNRCRPPTKSTSTANGPRDGKPSTVRKQPLTLVELLTAGVERPPHGPPRISNQHQSGQQLHIQQRTSSEILLHQQQHLSHHQQLQTVHQRHQPLHHAHHHQQHQMVQFSQQQQQHILQRESPPLGLASSRVACGGERPHERCVLDRSTGDRPHSHGNTTTSAMHCGNKKPIEDIELGSRSCILQLLRCPPTGNEDVKQRVWSGGVNSNHMALLDAVSTESSGRGQSTSFSPSLSNPSASSSSSHSLITASASASFTPALSTSATSSEPLIAEADSSNLPLDADLLSEMQMAMLTEPVHLATEPLSVGEDGSDQLLHPDVTSPCTWAR